jgi:hypothetical protein
MKAWSEGAPSERKSKKSWELWAASPDSKAMAASLQHSGSVHAFGHQLQAHYSHHESLVVQPQSIIKYAHSQGLQVVPMRPGSHASPVLEALHQVVVQCCPLKDDLCVV